MFIGIQWYHQIPMDIPAHAEASSEEWTQLCNTCGQRWMSVRADQFGTWCCCECIRRINEARLQQNKKLMKDRNRTKLLHTLRESIAETTVDFPPHYHVTILAFFSNFDLTMHGHNLNNHLLLYVCAKDNAWCSAVPAWVRTTPQAMPLLLLRHAVSWKPVSYDANVMPKASRR